VCYVFGQHTVIRYRKEEVGSLANLNPAGKLGTEGICIIMDDESLLYFIEQTQAQGSLFVKDHSTLYRAWAEVCNRQDNILRIFRKWSTQDPLNAE